MGKLREVLTDDEADQAGQVFTTHRRLIEAVAMRHAPTPNDVQDIVQTVGMQVCRGLNGFRSESEITTWLYRVTVNTARKHYRGEKRQRLAVEALTLTPEPDQVEHPDDVVHQAQRAEALTDAIEQLRAKDRAIICHELQGSGVLSYDRWARRRARQRLRRILDDDPALGE